MESLYTNLISVFLLILFSLLGRIGLVLAGQHWVKTFAHTSTLVFLPIIVFVITKVISGNIALSLGMVGALSIVRFRNPVKSPFELAVYFAAITMGISASVSLKWLIFLGCALALAIIVLLVIDIFLRTLFKRQFFQTSFTEGNALSTLEINANQRFKELDNNRYLISSSKIDNEYSYILASSRFSELQKIVEKYENFLQKGQYRISK